MFCKFHALAEPVIRRPLRSLLAHLLLALCTAPVLAERADRSRPVTIEADKPGTLDLLKQVVVFNGNVVIAQGTMSIRAERVEVRERGDGFRTATATGTAGKPANFRQKREGVDEFIEGSAEKIEYDGRGDVVRFSGAAVVRRMRGGAVADEIAGNLIAYDNLAELFSVEGGTPASNGRVRVTLTPRGAAAASAPAGSSAPAAAPAAGVRR